MLLIGIFMECRFPIPAKSSSNVGLQQESNKQQANTQNISSQKYGFPDPADFTSPMILICV